jgi:bifunctional DNase/RNase
MPGVDARQRARRWSLDVLTDGYLGQPNDPSSSPEVWAETAELARWVQGAVAELPAGQRQAVALFYLDGLTYAETATALGVGIGALKTRLHKARDSLRQSLSTWKEEKVTANVDAGFIDVRVEDVFGLPAGAAWFMPKLRREGEAPPSVERRIVLLAEEGSDRVLPIWVGVFEGDAIALLLVGAETRRPLTFPFAAQLLAAAGGSLHEVRVDRLMDKTFYAQVQVDGPVGANGFDARPSDAISLALVTGAPIRVARAVLDQAAGDRAEIKQRRPAEARSARERADEIRNLVSQTRLGRPPLF